MKNHQLMIVGFDGQACNSKLGGQPQAKSAQFLRVCLTARGSTPGIAGRLQSALTHVRSLAKAVSCLRSSSGSRFVWGAGSAYSFALTFLFGDCFGIPRVIYIGERENQSITSPGWNPLQIVRGYILRFFLRRADLVLSDEINCNKLAAYRVQSPIAVNFEDFLSYCDGTQSENANTALKEELGKLEIKLQVTRNISVHDDVATTYEASHDEIFNEPEQLRLANALANAVSHIQSAHGAVAALDYGCGSGNLTRHLTALTADVTSADVSNAFLTVIKSRFPSVKTHWLKDGEFGDLAQRKFDLIALYSVLHHIPDYLSAIADLAELIKPGGVLFLDHEPRPEYWTPTSVDLEYRGSVEKIDFAKYFKISNYWNKLRRIVDPRYTNEGDIHVWPDDHIEWPKIDELLKSKGFEIVILDDYLLFKSNYKPHVYSQFQNRCKDMRLTVYRKSNSTYPQS